MHFPFSTRERVTPWETDFCCKHVEIMYERTFARSVCTFTSQFSRYFLLKHTFGVNVAQFSYFICDNFAKWLDDKEIHAVLSEWVQCTTTMGTIEITRKVHIRARCTFCNAASGGGLLWWALEGRIRVLQMHSWNATPRIKSDVPNTNEKSCTESTIVARVRARVRACTRPCVYVYVRNASSQLPKLRAAFRS